MRARRKVRGAAWVRAQKVELGGRAWAEVYCGTPEAGAWIHLDPILGTVDRWGALFSVRCIVLLRHAGTAWVAAQSRC